MQLCIYYSVCSVLKQGNEKVILLPKRATNFQVSDRNFESITLFCDIPFCEQGRQLRFIKYGLTFPRPLLPEEHFDAVKLHAWAMDINRPRHDGFILKLLSSNLAKVVLFVFVTLTGKMAIFVKILRASLIWTSIFTTKS